MHVRVGLRHYKHCQQVLRSDRTKVTDESMAGSLKMIALPSDARRYLKYVDNSLTFTQAD